MLVDHANPVVTIDRCAICLRRAASFSTEARRCGYCKINFKAAPSARMRRMTGDDERPSVDPCWYLSRLCFTRGAYARGMTRGSLPSS